MAIITIQELIDKRDAIQKKKKRLYDLEIPSVGTIVVKPPTATLISESNNIEKSHEANAYLVYNCIVEPNLANDALQKAYGVYEPIEIVSAIFTTGEVGKIAEKLVELAGYNKNKITAKLHEEVKN